METGLRDKGVIVTGASGGIGAATARLFAAEGARVLVHYHRGADRAEAVAAELGGAPTAGADLRDEAAVDALFARAREALGQVDVCVANAGWWVTEDVPVWELSLEQWNETIGANLTATFLTARAFLREVQRNGHGSLVLVTSTSGVFGEFGHADYAAAKAGLSGGFLKTLKNEIVRIAPRGRVNAVSPGWTATPMVEGVLSDEMLARVTSTYALRKVATPEDVAAQIVVLASDELSGHVTGENVIVAGGMEGRLVHPG